MPFLGMVQGVPRDGMFVPRDTSPGTGYVVPMDGEDRTGRERKERLRARRDEAGMAQVSGWVPKDRRSYAREVLAALARGANHLPPDPEQVAALDAAQADATAARAAEAAARTALTEAEQHRQVLAAELDTARAEGEAAREAGRQAEAAVVARAETAEQAREAIAAELRVVETAAAQARADAERFQNVPGMRGRVVRWLVR